MYVKNLAPEGWKFKLCYHVGLSHSVLKHFRELVLNTTIYSFRTSQVCNSLVPGKGTTQRWDGRFLVVFFARLEGPQTRTIKCCIKWVLFQKLFVKDAFISRHDLVFLKSVWLHILTYDIFVSSLHIPAKCAISISWRYIPFPCSLGMHGFKANEFDLVVEVLLDFKSRITILGSSKCVNICCPCTKI